MTGRLPESLAGILALLPGQRGDVMSLGQHGAFRHLAALQRLLPARRRREHDLLCNRMGRHGGRADRA